MRTRLFFFSAAVVSLLCPACIAQTDVAASLYGAFNESTTFNSLKQSPSNSAGVSLDFRHISNPLVGYEATYAYNRADQAYQRSEVCSVLTCGYQPVSSAVPNNAHEITGDWIVSLKISSFRPFALAGGGILLNVPSSSSAPAVECSLNTGVCQSTTVSTNTSARGVFVYGAGLDWTVVPHLGLRFQYRGNVYKAAALTTAFSSTNAFTQTAEPMIGAFLRF